MFWYPKRLLASRISDGPDGPKFDKRARVSPSRSLRLPAGRGAAPSGARFARSGWSSPSRWAGSGCVSVKGALRPSSQSSLALALRAVRGSGLLRAALDPAPSSKRAYGPLRASWIRSSGLPGPQGTE